jgi:predicted nucleotide-binding protein (sugar kinase/HSP70/actin superfamily)
MTIGIPRALLYYKYGVLWETFFSELGLRTVVSPPSDRQILESGIRASVDESCLSAKLYMGHIKYLIGKCDYILIPRVETLQKGRADTACVKFFALYDIVSNTFREELEKSETKLLDYNVDVNRGKTEKRAFLGIAKTLGFSRLKALDAYLVARGAQDYEDAKAAMEAENTAYTDSAQTKILIVGHAYNIYDPMIGLPVINLLEKLGATVILANEFDAGVCAAAAADLSKTLYWTYNKELAGAISLYKDFADGIIFLTTFPCGTDSLVNDLLMRKLFGVPKLNLVLDELRAESGLLTRLESFVDIIKHKGNAEKSADRRNRQEPALVGEERPINDGILAYMQDSR